MRAIKRSIMQARDERQAMEQREAIEREQREPDARAIRERPLLDVAHRADVRDAATSDAAMRERRLLGIARSADARDAATIDSATATIDSATATIDSATSDAAIRERRLLGIARSADARDAATIDSATATIDSATIDSATIDSATIDSATIDSATIDSATIDSATATIDSATIDSATFDSSATCEHITRELTSRIDTRSSLARDTKHSSLTRDIRPLACEPCPRVIPSRRLFDGSLLRQFRCDGTCARDQRREREKSQSHDAQHARWEAAQIASRHELRTQIAITTLLALLAAMWIVLAAREAGAEPRKVGSVSRSGDASIDDHLDDDEAIDVAAPPSREPPFGAPVVAPPIAEVLAAAYRTAGLDRELGTGLVRRSRLAGLVPWLSVRTGRDTSWRDDNPDIARGVTLEVRATWRLDRLVFDGRELQVASFEGARRRERRRLAARVIQVYFAWKRAARAAGLQASAAARAEEAAAELDDLTDGWFMEARGGQRP
jgi:hypothetical protein